MAKRGRKEIKKPKFVVEFDNEKTSQEEQSFLISRFIQVLTRLDNKRKGANIIC